MADARIVRFDRLELAFAPRRWRFSDERRAEIDAAFAALRRDKPALWNGPVLLLHDYSLDGAIFRGSYLQTDYASFRLWHDWGHPDRTMRDCFAQAVLLAADGAVLLGVMGRHTAVPGKLHFPSGTPDPSDIVGDTVDLDASVWRELNEETGLTAADVVPDADWHGVFCGASIAMMKIFRAREDAVTLRQRIRRALAEQHPPELSDMRIVRGPAETDPMMPDFILAFLAHFWSAPG